VFECNDNADVVCLYRTDSVTLEDVFQYNDTAKDHFEREPFSAKFSCQKAGGMRSRHC